MLEGFVPSDRRRALARGTALAEAATGTAVFCDIVGYSAQAADLLRQHGRHVGAEHLHRMLDDRLGEIVAKARRRGGFPLSFAGDAVTLWFDAVDAGGPEQAAAQAAATALDLGRRTGGKALRLSVASGVFRRTALGDAEQGWHELLSGEPSRRLALLDRKARAGQVLVCDATARLLDGPGAILRPLPESGAQELDGLAAPPPGAPPPLPPIDHETALAWVPRRLRPTFRRLALKGAAGDLAALAEIRPITALFVLMSGAEHRLPEFFRILQRRVDAAGGMLAGVSVDAKGTYAVCLFGAPTAQEDDPERALGAALSALDLAAEHGVDLRIGAARGTGLAGPMVAEDSLRYGTIGVALNQAARLMERAEPGMVLATADLARRGFAEFEWAEVTDGDKARAWRVLALRDKAESTRLSAAGAGPLIGRAAVVERLGRALDTEGRALVVLESPPGFGKSALTAHLRRGAEAAGRLWLQGRAEGRFRDVALHAWGPIFRDLMERAAELSLGPEDAGILGWLAGESAAPPAALASLAGSERAGRIGATVVAAIAALNALQPVTLAFDDLHWADTRTLGLILAVVGSGVPVRVLLARRPEEPGSMEAAMLLGDPSATVVPLDRLDPSAVLELAAVTLGARTLSYDLERLFIDAAGGSPLFVSLIAEVLKDRGLVELREGHCSALAGAGKLGKLDFLESEEAAILARFDEMPRDRREALRVASVLGQSFAAEALNAAFEGQEAGAAEALLWSGYVERHIDRSAVAYRFVHPVVQQAILDSLSFARRAEIDGRLARFWAGRSEPDAPLRRARHFLGSIDRDERDPDLLKQVIAALEDAAQLAAAEATHLEAGALLEDAVALARRLPEGAETDRMQLQLQAGLAFGLATFRGYGDPSVEAAYKEALRMANASENSENLAFTIYGLFSFYSARGDYAEAMPIARRLHRLALQFDDLRLHSISHHSRAILAILRGRLKTGIAMAALSITDADRIGHGRFFPHGGAGDFRIFSGTWLALALAISGRPEEAETAFREALRLGETEAFPRSFLKGFAPLPVLCGSPAEALAHAEDILSEADGRGFALFSVVGRIYRGWAAALLGFDDERVSGFLDVQIHIARAMGLGSFTPWFLVMAAEAHLARGAVGLAAVALDEADGMIRRSSGGLFASEVIRVRALVSAAQGEDGLAERLMQRSRAEARRRGLHLFAARPEGLRAAPEPVPGHARPPVPDARSI